MRELAACGVLILLLSLAAPAATQVIPPQPVPEVAAGFAIAPLAAMPAPTAITWGPGGDDGPDLYATTLTGDVWQAQLLWTIAGPVVTGIETYATGFGQPLGLAFVGDRLAVADSHGYEDHADYSSAGRVTLLHEGGGDQTTGTVIVDGLPQGQHNVNNLRVGPDGRLYLPNGNPNDQGTGTGTGHPDAFPLTGAFLSVDVAEVEASPAILRWNDAGDNDIAPGDLATHPANADFMGKVDVFAHGFRNIYDIAFAPDHLPFAGEAYTGTNGADDPASQDLLYQIQTGADHGFPYCTNSGPSGGVGDDITVGDSPAVPAALPPGPDCATVPKATANLGWHVCATGLDFPTATGNWAFPDSHQQSVYVGECGPFDPFSVASNSLADPANASHNTGHKVVRVALDENGEATEVKDFVSGIPLPLDVLFGPDGALYIANANGVSRVAPVVPAGTDGPLVGDLPVPDPGVPLPPLPEPPAANEVTVAAALFSFLSPVVAVPAGTTVVWDGLLLGHTVTTTSQIGGTTYDTPPGPDSFNEPLPQGGEVRHTYETPGIFNYYCIPHAGLGMVGVVVVTDDPTG